MPRLKVKRIETIGLVDKGDNPAAEIAIWKRAPEESVEKTTEQDTLLQRITKAIAAALGAEAETVLNTEETVPEETKVEITEQPEAKATITPEAGDVAKRLEALEKALNDEKAAREAAEKQAQEAIGKADALALQKRNADYIAKAAEFKSLPIKAEEFGPILRKIADGEKLETAEFEQVEKALAAANEAVRAGKLFEEIGSGGEGGDVTKQVEAKAEEVRKAHPDWTDEQALAEVFKKDPKLMAAYDAERGHRATVND